jgi:hypothetical protein
MKKVLVRLITGAMLLLCIVVCAWWAGREHAFRVWEAHKVQIAREAARAIDQEWERGEQATQALRLQLDAHHVRYHQLEGTYREYKRTHPLLAGADSGVVPNPVMPAMVANVLPASHTAHSGGGDDPFLTVGAVWLWNEALALDHSPAGTCGAIGASKASCDAASGISLGNVWENHRVNAQICADNRLAHQRLIDYIQQAPGTHAHE